MSSFGRLPGGVTFTTCHRLARRTPTDIRRQCFRRRSLFYLPDDSAGRWWTWAGTAANRSLQASLPQVVDPRQRVDEKSLRLRPEVTLREFQDAIASVDWRDPLVDANAVRGLKFSAALPVELAIATLAARIGDQAAARAVFHEQRVIHRHD